MSGASGALLAVGLSLAGMAEAQTSAPDDVSRALTDLDGAKSHKQCRGDEPDAVVVCGHRSDRYRIDRTVLQSSRAAHANPPKASPSAQALNDMRYANPQDRGRVIPNDVTKMPLEKAIVAAIKGEDWTEPLREGPGEYGAYQAAKDHAGK